MKPTLVLALLKDSCALSVHTLVEGIQYSTGITCLERTFFTPTDRLELTYSSSLEMPVTMDAVAGIAAAPAAAAGVAGASDAPVAGWLAAASLNPDMPGIVCCIFGTLA